MSARPLHVVVGVGPAPWPGAPTEFSADVRLVKAALLYGDGVTLCSPAAALVSRLLRLESAEPDTAGQLVVLEALAGDLDLGDGPRLLAEAYAALNPRPGEPWAAAARRAWIEQVAADQWEDVRLGLRADLARGGHGELLAAVEAGWLGVDGLTLDAVADPSDFAPVAADAYAERVLDAVVGGLAVPMFDASTADLLRQRAAGVAEPQAGWARQGGLAADWLPRLPLFDLATVAETLEVRRDLGPHLARFRAAVIEFGDAAGSAVWDADFPLDAERVFRRDVAPAVQDIEDAVVSVGFLRELTSRYADGPQRFLPLAAPALTLGLAAPAGLLDVVAGALAASSLGANVAQAWHTSQERRRDAEAHRLYFYYEAGQRFRRKV